MGGDILEETSREFKRRAWRVVRDECFEHADGEVADPKQGFALEREAAWAPQSNEQSVAPKGSRNIRAVD
jgi:hypothetical protein